jgi:RNA polymerase sigma factor (sigma-70 family)
MSLRTSIRSASDSEILASGDPGVAFSELFDRHYATIHRYLVRRLGRELADELAAETFAVALARRRSYDPGVANARPWLFGIATRLAKRHWRRERRELRAYARTGVDRISPFEDEAVERADSQTAGPQLAASLAALRREERDVLLLYAWADLSHPEIAAALGLPVGTVKSRLSRARHHLRQALSDQIEAESGVEEK